MPEADPPNFKQPTTDLEALERFVVDNDDLLALEERIGRFNLFDALGIARREVSHSQFLAWLLDPAESHGQGPLFLRAVLMDLLRQTPAPLRPFSPVDLDGAELRGVEVRREWRHIDLLIKCDEPRFVIAVENKVDSGEHSDQLERYRETVDAEFGGVEPGRRMFVFLTKDAAPASDEAWVPYGYADLHRVLSRVRRSNVGTIGDDVAAFLDHYLQLVESQFMEDAQIVDLCKRIYKHHRRAIDLIFDNTAAGDGGCTLALSERLLQPDGDTPGEWHILRRTPRMLEFMPTEWVEAFPALGEPALLPDPRAWLRLWFAVEKNAKYQRTDVRLCVELGPLHSPSIREGILAELTSGTNDFGLANTQKAKTWSRLFGRVVYHWPDGEDPDGHALVTGAAETLNPLRTRLAGVPAALTPIFD